MLVDASATFKASKSIGCTATERSLRARNHAATVGLHHTGQISSPIDQWPSQFHSTTHRVPQQYHTLRCKFEDSSVRRRHFNRVECLVYGDLWYVRRRL